ERLHTCYRNDSFREVAPGVWLPWEQSRVAHRGPTPGEIPDDELLVFLRATSRVRNLRVNDVPEETFTFRPPPGTAVTPTDKKGGEFVTPGGVDLLDQSARTGGKILRLRAAGPPPPDKMRHVFWPLTGTLAGTAVVVGLWLAVRGRRRASAPL